MARRENSNNTLKIQDHISDSKLSLNYRMPTTKEVQAYINKRYERKKNRMVDNTAQVRITFGKRIITGVNEGDFERTIGEDQYKPISSDKSSPNYYPEWKDWMAKNASDILTILAVRVFENSASIMPDMSEQEDDLEDAELEDLEKE